MSDGTSFDLAAFFSAADVDQELVEHTAEAAYVSHTTLERFAQLLREHAGQPDAGTGGALRVALGLHLLGRHAEALTAFKQAGRSKFRYYYAAQSNLALGNLTDALDDLEKAESAGWDAFAVEMQRAIVQARSDEVAAAQALVSKHARIGADRADWYFVRGLLAEHRDEREAALEEYDKALTLEPAHEAALFRSARLSDICGDDEKAVELYRRLAARPRAHVNALLNLSVIYEDIGKYDDAARCLQRVLRIYPNHHRARLFLKDVESSRKMVIDDFTDRRVESRTRLLDAPISEFELSVRARNCLKKMKIHTLGDLTQLSESELLAYKNFGETSLTEIKALLEKKGLRLGQRPEEVDVAALASEPPPKVTVPPGKEAMLNRPVSELELSVRARRCLQRLNVMTLGDLIQHSEAELLATRNFGVTSLNEINSRLTELGLKLAPKRPE